ncbi:hypothetical protein H0H93_007065, partial [Arthromyces matolae]
CNECHWTVFHTEPYVYEDAVLLLSRLQHPNNPLYTRTNQPLRYAPPSPVLEGIPSTQNSRIDCINPECFTKSGQRTQGSKTCIDNCCKNCCKAAAVSARESGQGRARCNAHGQEGIPTAPPPPPQQQQPSLSAPLQHVNGPYTGPRPIVPITINLQPPLSHGTTGPLTQPSSGNGNAPPPPPPPPSTQSSTWVAPPRPSQPTSLSVAPTLEPRSRRQPLAQPLHHEWAGAHSVAERERTTLKTLKIQKEEMQKREERTILLVVWFALLKDLDIASDSYLDLWQGEWNTVTVDTVFHVEKNQRVLLRLRPNLRTTIMDCPEMDDEMEMQSKRRPVGSKRAAAVLVSPLKKAPRTADALSITHKRPISPPSLPASITKPQPLPQSHSRSHHPWSRSRSRGRSPSPRRSPSPHHSRGRSPQRHRHRNVSVSSSHSQRKKSASKSKSKPLDRWPHSFYVSDIDEGLKKMNKLRSKNKSLTVPEAFEKVFRTKFVRTTAYKYINQWPNYDEDIKQRFITYGRTSRGLCDVFLRMLAKPELLDSSSSESSSSKSRSSSPYMAAPRHTSSPSTSIYSPLPSKSSGTPSSSKTSADSNTESSLLCEYCDEEMPHNPSYKLLSMQITLSESLDTWSQPTLENPRHREAKSFTVYISYCERHRFELQLLPEAEREGWPQNINFTLLSHRIIKHQETLEALLDEPSESLSFQQAHLAATTKGKGKGPGTWDRFTQQSVGYYGEIGYEVIARTLQSMFSQESVDMTTYAPLSWNDVLFEVLVPEIAAILIQEDLEVSYKDAVSIRNRSRQFGNLMHPSDSEEGRIITELVVAAPQPMLVKCEPQELLLKTNTIGSSSRGEGDVIDLTLDSD